METYFSFAMLCFTSFITLMNPLGIMPVFMTMTDSLDKEERRRTAKKANIVAAITLIVFAFSGQLLFKFFGISVNSFRVVGGIIFFMMGWDMLQAKLVKVKMNKESVNREYVDDISVTPLAIPMICGPGAITSAIVLMEDAQTAEMKGIVIASILVVTFIGYLVLWSSGKITVWLGETGNKIMMRLMGLIVMVIAVEFFFSGLKPILIDMLNAKA
ncbi:MarC family protein [Vicingaceae bacterium]|nr:MarC family protein [Vicingaceae bacterium]MDB4060643.1 MarC family protein [Vicingaceae bacterium]